MYSTNPQDYSCPKCHQMDTVQKVSSVVSAGTATGTYAGPTSAVGYSSGNQGGYSTMSGYTTLAGTSQTSLAQRLSCPPRPTYKSPWGFWSICFLIIVGIPALTGTIFSFGSEQVLYGFFWLILVVLVIWYKQHEASKRRAKVEAETPRWELAYQRWNELYYCSRNDVVFMPRWAGVAQACVPTSEMLRLL
jgi:hypothetical protein